MIKRDIVIAVSLANLMFSDVWFEFLAPVRELNNTFRTLPGPQDFAAVMINVALLSAAFLGATMAVRKSGSTVLKGIFRWVFLLSLLLPMDQISTRYWNKPLQMRVSRLWNLHIFLFIPSAVILLWLLFYFNKSVTNAAKTLLVVLFSIVPFTIGQAAWGMITLDQKQLVSVSAASSVPASSPPHRVIWLIFDGMDGGDAVFGNLAANRLPNLDGFKRQAIYAPDAFPPGHETRISMPSYILGETVSTLLRSEPKRLLIFFEGKRGSYSWTDQPTIFSKARDRGVETGLLGWHIPYCTVMGQSLDSCFTQIFDTAIPDGDPGIMERALKQARRRLPFHLEQEHIERSRTGLRKAIEIGTDPRFGLALIHWSVPHFPPIYDRTTHRYTVLKSANAPDAYLNNVTLADDVFGEFKSAVDRAGLWENSTIILTADHPAALPPRPNFASLPVPFFVKTPGQHQGETLGFPVQTIAIHELTLAILGGDVQTPAQVVEWLTRHNPKASRP